MSIMQTDKGGDLAQSYDKSPYTHILKASAHSFKLPCTRN